MSTQVEFEGKDISEAVEKACFAHQVTESELEYEVIRRQSKKLFGLIGGKSALIRVKKSEITGKNLVQDLIKSTFGDEAVGVEKGPKSKPVAKKTDSSPPVENRKKRSEERVLPEFDTTVIQASVKQVLQLMGLTKGDIDSSQRENELHLNIQGEGFDLLTKKRGTVLDALQFLVNKMHGVKGGRIFIDCNGFRSSHEEDISGLALRLGAKAKRLRKPVTINSLNAHDRRLVHMALQDDQELRSRSKGEGEYKKVVIYPNNSQRRRSRNNSTPASASVV